MMVRQCLRWACARRRRKLCCCLVLLFLVANVLVYRHAYTMTHFALAGGTSRPQDLSLLQKAGAVFTGLRMARPCSPWTPANVGLPFRVDRFRAADGSTLEGWYIPHRQSRGLVVLFHGYGSCKAWLLPELEAFHELGYAAFMVDFRGSGGSDGAETTIGISEADDVASAVAYARRLAGRRPLVLYGQSMGSSAILRAISVDGVRPSAVIVECPFDRLISTLENRFTAVGVPSFPWAQMLLFWGGVQHGFNGFTHNPVDYARDVRCPALMLHGDRDTLVTLDQAKSVFANLAGQKELAVLPGLGHESYVSAQPVQWKHWVSRFLDAHAATPEVAGGLPAPSGN